MRTKTYFLSGLLLIAFLAVSAGCRKDSKRKVKKNHRQEVGKSANDLLSDDDYESVVIEIQYMTGFQPTDQTVSLLKSFVSERSHKKSISVKYSEITPHGKASYSLDDIVAIEDDKRTQFTAKKTIAVYFLFVDGDYSGNTSGGSVLGIAYYNTSLVIFEKTIIGLTNGFGSPERYKLETTVVNHEYGHILGLVNLGSSMQTQHQDAANGNHCTNENCLMYWEAESGSMVSNLLGSSPIPTLDANCLSDLQANGGK